jgi:hypothetical protein
MIVGDSRIRLRKKEMRKEGGSEGKKLRKKGEIQVMKLTLDRGRAVQDEYEDRTQEDKWW